MLYINIIHYRWPFSNVDLPDAVVNFTMISTHVREICRSRVSSSLVEWWLYESHELTTKKHAICKCQVLCWLAILTYIHSNNISWLGLQLPISLWFMVDISIGNGELQNNLWLVGGLEHVLFLHSVGNHHPKWRTHIFQRGWNHQPVIRCSF